MISTGGRAMETGQRLNMRSCREQVSTTEAIVNHIQGEKKVKKSQALSFAL